MTAKSITIDGEAVTVFVQRDFVHRVFDSPVLQPGDTEPAELDLVGRLLKFLSAEFPHLDADALVKIDVALRSEFKGEHAYIANRPPTDRQKTVAEVLRLFNGYNATEVCRRLNISRATVYRIIKQAGTR